MYCSGRKSFGTVELVDVGYEMAKFGVVLPCAEVKLETRGNQRNGIDFGSDIQL